MISPHERRTRSSIGDTSIYRGWTDLLLPFEFPTCPSFATSERELRIRALRNSLRARARTSVRIVTIATRASRTESGSANRASKKAKTVASISLEFLQHAGESRFTHEYRLLLAASCSPSCIAGQMQLKIPFPPASDPIKRATAVAVAQLAVENLHPASSFCIDAGRAGDRRSQTYLLAIFPDAGPSGARQGGSRACDRSHRDPLRSARARADPGGEERETGTRDEESRSGLRVPLPPPFRVCSRCTAIVSIPPPLLLVRPIFISNAEKNDRTEMRSTRESDIYSSRDNSNSRSADSFRDRAFRCTGQSA